MRDISTTTQHLTAFDGVVDAIYGVYLDATMAFQRLTEQIAGYELQVRQLLEARDPQLADTYDIETMRFIHGKGKPDDPQAEVLHECTLQELKRRNSPSGTNYKFIGNMCLVSLYHFWEEYYRETIAESLGIEKDDVTSPVMGDIRHLRHSIIHHDAIAIDDVSKCQVLCWFKPGDDILLDKNLFRELVTKLKEEMTTWPDQWEALRKRR
jgi:hypothetical protein